MQLQLRDYQQECIETVKNKGTGRWMVQMATGLGKTVTFAAMPRDGRTLILSHREELVNQPRRYFDCSFGVEQGLSRSSGEEVVSASVPSIVRRLENFAHDEFSTVIVDEAHHSAANTYRRILDYFQPRQLVGFTATPNRGDGLGLYDIYDEIVFQRDIRWGIENGWLADIDAVAVDIGVNLDDVKIRAGDFSQEGLDCEYGKPAAVEAVAEAYWDYAEGKTLIFAVSIEHAYAIAEEIGETAAVITGATSNRAEIITALETGSIDVLVNCMVLTEGVDIPSIRTVMVARPTRSATLYAQMVGRGLRKAPGKDRMLLIDCVGGEGARGLQTAPSLLGAVLPPLYKDRPVRLLLAVDEEQEAALEKDDWREFSYEGSIVGVREIDLWAQEYGYNLGDVYWNQLPNGDLYVTLPEGERIYLPAADLLGMTIYDGERMRMQDALNAIAKTLRRDHAGSYGLWGRKAGWRSQNIPPTEKQIQTIERMARFHPDEPVDYAALTKGSASDLIGRWIVAWKQ